MLHDPPRRTSRHLRGAFLALAAVGFGVLGQLNDGVPRTASASVLEAASSTVAPAPPELPERAHRPARGQRGSAVAGAVAPSERVEATAAVPVASVAVVPTRATVSAPAPTVAPTAPGRATTQPAACPGDWVCYARVGLSGPIVPYTDCSGGSDVGTAIRAFMCLSPTYLLGHAHTPFGKITQWRAGDVVYAYGRPYTVTGATTQSSCAPPVLPLAPLSLQTSLSPNTCGLVLVVQAR